MVHGPFGAALVHFAKSAKENAAPVTLQLTNSAHQRAFRRVEFSDRIASKICHLQVESNGFRQRCFQSRAVLPRPSDAG